MKIHFEQTQPAQVAGQVTTSQSKAEGTSKVSHAAFALDISGRVKDNCNAYGVQGRTTEEIMQSAEQQDITVQQNYMTVMSNSMSGEDFAKLQEEGYHAQDMEPEEFVTIVDKIKAVVAQSGVTVAGYNEDLDADTLREITGSEVMAQAIVSALKEADTAVSEENVKQLAGLCEKISGMPELTDKTIAYMVSNHMEPTLEQLYLASYSSVGGNMPNTTDTRFYKEDIKGYYGQTGGELSVEKMEEQLRQVIEEAGYPVSKQTMEDAAWMLGQMIPLTPENFATLEGLKELKMPFSTKQILNYGAKAISAGKTAGQANVLMSPEETVYEQAARIWEEVQEISDEAADKVAEEGKRLTIRNLQEAERTLSRGDKAAELTSVEARLKLEEVRLQMTVEANIKLLKSNYSIETMELEQLVQELRQIRDNLHRIYFGTSSQGTVQSDATTLYDATRKAVQDISGAPAAVLGKYSVRSIEFTLETVSREGTALQKAYQEAGEAYETLMTAPRKDMGDSIRTAFRNVDAILEDMELDITAENQRAVRILGYNSMEITAENIMRVKAVDQSVQNVIKTMTPANTLEMIRDGKNPLEMNIQEINEYFEGKETFEQESRKYSEFLYHLEQSRQISAEEKESYIGIYRLLRQLEKNDGAAIGAVMQEQAELSFKNLLSAVRTEKKKGVDVKVTEDFGGITKAPTDKMSITDQIYAAFDSDEAVYRKELARHLRNQMSAEPDSEYLLMQQQQMREMLTKTDIEWSFLREHHIPVTYANLEAAGSLLKGKGKSLETLWEYTKESDISLEDTARKCIQAVGEEEDTVEKYQEAIDGIREAVEQRADGADVTSLDIRQLSTLHKQLSLMSSLAKEQCYEVPLKMNGVYTSVRVTFQHGNRAEQGRLEISFETELLGEVRGDFTVMSQSGQMLRAEGYFITNTQAAVAKLSEVVDKLSQKLEDGGKVQTSFQILEMSGDRKNVSGVRRVEKETPEEQLSGERISNREIYHLAEQILLLLHEQ